MQLIVPDFLWYQKKSALLGVSAECPFANVHKCPRFYASVSMLGNVGLTTAIPAKKREALDKFWEATGLLPVIEEEDTGVGGEPGKWESFTNFCPEVTFKYFGYYASYMAKYVDEVDRDYGQQVASRDSIQNDWRHEWGFLTACHHSQCSVFNQVEAFNFKNVGGFNHLAHANVLTLIGRMERCVESKDVAGVLHASASILETVAKDVLASDQLETQTLGSFIKKYEAESMLPTTIKVVVNEIYKLRNSMPLSGHGSTKAPSMTLHDAIVLSAATKFIVEVEYRSINQE